MKSALAILCVAVVASCSDAPSEPAISQENLLDAVKAMGFRTDNVVDAGDYLIVEGDIRLSKARLRTLKSGLTLHRGTANQYHTTNLVSQSNVSSIVVDTSGLETSWKTAASSAIAEWNAITPGVRIVMTAGTSAVDIVLIMDALLPSNFIAQADFPIGGQPGGTVRVNPAHTSALSASQKKFAIAHELGHTIGFRHTNWNQHDCGSSCNGNPGSDGAVHIPNTPTSGNDAASVMNGVVANWNGFSSYDKVAAFHLYHRTDNPNVSVSYPAGVPTFSWSSLPESPTYSIGFFEYYWWIDDQNEFQSGSGYVYGPTTSGTSTTWPQFPYTGYSSCQQGPGGGPGTSYSERSFFVQINYPSGNYSFTLGPAEIVPC